MAHFVFLTEIEAGADRALVNLDEIASIQARDAHEATLITFASGHQMFVSERLGQTAVLLANRGLA